MKLISVLLLAVATFAEVSPSLAQLPGYWIPTTICQPCESPTGLAVDSNTAVVILKSSFRGFETWHTETYYTSDKGNSWSRHIDTLALPVQSGDPMYLHNNQLVVSQSKGGTIHSRDYGRSFQEYRHDPQQDLDAFSPDPSTIVRIAYRNEELQEVDVLMSRDSGMTFEHLTSLIYPDYNILQARIKDTNEFWVAMHGRYDQGSPVKRRRLLVTTNQGKAWSEVFPLDTNGTTGTGTNFGYGTDDNRYDGMTPGKRKGSLYLLSNWYKSTSVDSRFFSLLYTTDFGKTWGQDSTHVIPSSPRFDVQFMRNSQDSQLWLIHHDSQSVSFTPDNAKTWYKDSTTFRGHPVEEMVWESASKGYVLTYSKDSTITFWRFVPGPSSVEHYQNGPRAFFRLLSSWMRDDILTFYSIEPLSGEFTVRDILGRVIWRKGLSTNKGELNDLSIPVSRGVFFLTYRDGDQQQSARFIQD